MALRDRAACDDPPVEVHVVRDPPARELLPLLREYAASLSFDLGFQDFERELAGLPGPYGPPGGGLLLAEADGHPAGCVAVRPFEANAGELKRLYVRPSYRGLGIGRRLAEEAIRLAAELGYRHVRLDTTPEMASAHELYRRLGFREIEPYRHNPVPGTRYLELELPASPAR